jgi:hypothetical protein
MLEIRDDAFFSPPRIVNPRHRTSRRLSVVAIHGQNVLTEDGQVTTLDELVSTLPKLKPTLFVKYSSADWLAELDEKFAPRFPSWQWHATSKESAIVRPDGLKVAARVSTVVHFFGFKNGQYHKVIDPVTMHARSIDDIWPSDEPKIVRLLKWAITLRDFCDDNNLEVRPTIGSISIQFLTDRRFYPDARRKVPRLTNDSVRERLPGNFYYLGVRPGPHREYTAYYLDQRRAHHHHARTTALPDANGLYALGCFQDVRMPCVFDNVWPNFYGLYCLDLDSPTDRQPRPYVRDWLRDHFPPGSTLEARFIYSNELDFLYEQGYTVRGVRAAWGSHRQDTGLAKYAEWAESQLDTYGEQPWLKPVLLATYGTLAMRPRIAEAVFRSAKRGERVDIPVGKNVLHGMMTKGKIKVEPRIANVLHRGMIESATRRESLDFAYYLTMKHYRVLSIYADAVIVQVNDDQELPLIIEPWRLKETLHHLEFINTQSFQSGEMTKMPGVAGTSRDAVRHSVPGRAPSGPPRPRKYDALTGKPVPQHIQSRKERVGEPHGNR